MPEGSCNPESRRSDLRLHPVRETFVALLIARLWCGRERSGPRWTQASPLVGECFPSDAYHIRDLVTVLSRQDDLWGEAHLRVRLTVLPHVDLNAPKKATSSLASFGHSPEYFLSNILR
jgi:hypothetical protein